MDCIDDKFSMIDKSARPRTAKAPKVALLDHYVPKKPTPTHYIEKSFSTWIDSVSASPVGKNSYYLQGDRLGSPRVPVGVNFFSCISAYSMA